MVPIYIFGERMKRIVVEPCFNEAHLLEAHIRNICDYLHPDMFVIAEGAFPRGPENTLEINDKFKSLYTLDGYRSFDFNEMQNTINHLKNVYPEVEFQFLQMNYGDVTTQVAYRIAYDSFQKDYNPDSEDIIFMLETDLFITKSQADRINQLCDELKPDEGFCSTFRTFFESPQVCIRGLQDRKRKVAVKYGTGKTYHKVGEGNFYDSYLQFLPIYDLKLFHYEWIRPLDYFELRLAQLQRDKVTENALRQCRKTIMKQPKNLQWCLDRDNPKESRFTLTLNAIKPEDHPIHIWTHPNFERYYGNLL